MWLKEEKLKVLITAAVLIGFLGCVKIPSLQRKEVAASLQDGDRISFELPKEADGKVFLILATSNELPKTWAGRISIKEAGDSRERVLTRNSMTECNYLQSEGVKHGYIVETFMTDSPVLNSKVSVGYNSSSETEGASLWVAFLE